TAGFAGKFALFLGPLGVSYNVADEGEVQQFRLFVILALIGALNAAVGAWYYLRIGAVMYLREPREGRAVRGEGRGWPVLTAVGACALLTLVFGVYPRPLFEAAQASVARGETTQKGVVSRQ